ncbi:MAG TPA: hypothetical protein VND62_11300 [Acidimicrobiales bacterium]|nr:hypothetical protein [Acidimicrobiales bacterium]
MTAERQGVTDAEAREMWVDVVGVRDRYLRRAREADVGPREARRMRGIAGHLTRQIRWAREKEVVAATVR